MPDQNQPTPNQPRTRRYGQRISAVVLLIFIGAFIINTILIRHYTTLDRATVQTELRKVLSDYQADHLQAMDNTSIRTKLDITQFESDYTLLSAADLQNLTQLPGALKIIDLREQTSWQHGYIPGAEHIRLGDLLNDTALTWYSPDQTIVFVCHTGTTSFLLVELLRQQGFDNVYFIGGGIYHIVPKDPDFYFVGEYREQLTVPLNIKHPPNESVSGTTHWLDMRQDINAPTPQQITSHVMYAKRTALYWETSTTNAIETTMQKMQGNPAIGIICDSRLSCYSAEVAITLYPDHAWTGIYDTRTF